MSLYYTGKPTEGPLPRLKKKARGLFKRIDNEYEKYEAKRAQDADKLRELEEEDRLKRMREEAAALRAKQKRDMEERHAKVIRDTEEDHMLARAEFQKKYAQAVHMNYVEFKELWEQSEYGCGTSEDYTG